MSNWIRIEDDLPSLIMNENGEASDYVLVYCPSPSRVKYTGDWYFIAYYTIQGWCYQYGDLLSQEDATYLSHWCRLPALPTKQ